MAAPSISTSSPVTYFTSSPSDNISINALIANVKWGNNGIGTGATVYYSFPESSSAQLWSRIYRINTGSEIYDDFSALSSAQVDAAETSLQAWSNVANLDFIKVESESFSSVGDIRIANSGLLSTYTYAYAYFPALNNPVGGDVWFNTDQPIASGNDYSLGGNGLQTMMHEIGHALGLDHPFADDHDSASEVTLSQAEDHYQYSIMSYSDVAGKRDTGYSTFYPTTPMLYDVLAIQYLYGANVNYNTGSNTYTFGVDYAYETIWDAGGIDTIQNAGSLDSVINLNAGEFSSIGPSVKTHRNIDHLSQENIAIAYEVTIENAVGGSGNDTIYGNTANNTINGGGGEDTFVIDLNRNAIDEIIIENNVVTLNSTHGADSLSNIEYIRFSDTTVATSALSSTQNERTSTPSFSSYIDGVSATASPETYVGPVNYLEYQFLGNSSNEVVIGADTNDFINLLGGDDAAKGGGGDDIIDGGTGSNFLTGGTGTDTFYIDGRSGVTTWSTITDFGSDSLNLWGWQEGISQVLVERTDGADGYAGATLHIDLDGNQEIDTSITFTGLDNNEINDWQTAEIAGLGYLVIG